MRGSEEMSVVEVEVEVRVLNGLDGFQVRYDGICVGETENGTMAQWREWEPENGDWRARGVWV